MKILTLCFLLTLAVPALGQSEDVSVHVDRTAEGYRISSEGEAADCGSMKMVLSGALGGGDAAPSCTDLNQVPKDHPEEWAPWVKHLPGSSGYLIYLQESEGTFTGTLTLKGLEPGKRYTLTLNGKPEHPGHRRLPDTWARWNPREKGEQGPVERYTDVIEVTADAEGKAKNLSFVVRLDPGDYDLKVLTKEQDSENYPVVLFHEAVQFEIHEQTAEPLPTKQRSKPMLDMPLGGDDTP